MQDQAMPQKSWFGRNWKWVVPVGCLTPILVCGGFFTLIFGAVFGMIKSSDVYQQSLAMVQSDPAVIAELGDTIEPGFFVTGNISIQNSAGDADIFYSVSGPMGQGQVHAVATRSQSVWMFDTVKITIGSNVIDVLANVEKASDPAAKP